MRNTLLIGDTLPDMAAASQIRIHSLLVRWGHPADVDARDVAYTGADVTRVEELSEAVGKAMTSKIVSVSLEGAHRSA